MITLKLLGLLLSYPTEEMQHHMGEIKEAIEQEGLVPTKLRKPLFAFMDDLERRSILRIQEDYVALFDRSRANSLYLFEHVHGESRDRGQAMVDLMGIYKTHGFKLAKRELPDYLPLFLEYLSVRPFAEAQEMLAETAHILAAVGAKLKVKKSPYQHIFRILADLTDVEVDPKVIEQATIDAGREDQSLEALDREWEEAPAFDGTGGVADCAVCPQATRPEATRPEAKPAAPAAHTG